MVVMSMRINMGMMMMRFGDGHDDQSGCLASVKDRCCILRLLRGLTL
jgi:hypothetical protein